MPTKDTILQSFRNIFPNAAPPIIVRSPGRINIIGEHTDYNNGFVLPAAIDKAVWMAVAPRTDDCIRLYAGDFNEHFSIRVAELQPVSHPHWPNYILGSVAQFIRQGIPVTGFDALLTSNLPIGAGVSSSAAVECATVLALNELMAARLEKTTLIKMAQLAEHEYAGVRCGIMDQFASMMGKKDQLIKLDCRSLAYEYVPFALEDYKVILLNTNVKHSLASSEYNTRRQECEQGVQWIQAHDPAVGSLRDATPAQLDQYVRPQNETVYRRCLFVVQEIERLLSACADLRQGNLAALGKKMFATHDGLRDDYQVSCRELDWLIEQVRNHDAVLGARMMGGGFGGCTINLVRTTAIGPLVEALAPAYEKEMGLPLHHYMVSTDDGTGILS